jgi:hypothetical protein
MVSDVPGAPAAPGRRTPPELILTDPTVPVPVSVAPLATVLRLELAIEPVTSSVPALILVGPV